VKQDAEIASIDAQLPAHFVLVPLFEQNSSQDAAVLGGEFSNQGPDSLLGLAGKQLAFQVHRGVPPFRHMLVELSCPALLAVVLEDQIVADRVHEGAKPLRMPHPGSLAKRAQDAQEHFLPEFFHLPGGPQAEAQLDEEQGLEIADEMLFGGGVSVGESADVAGVEGEKLDGPVLLTTGVEIDRTALPPFPAAEYRRRP
jgi:hypothetical protein